jgi:hypothetical protein
LLRLITTEPSRLICPHLPIHSPHETAPVILVCFNGRGDESSACVRLGTLSSIYLGLGE